MTSNNKFITIIVIIGFCLIISENTRFTPIDNHLTISLNSYLEWVYVSGREDDSFGESICVADLDGNGMLEIVFGSGSDVGRVYCLDFSGKKMWSFNTEHLVLGTPSIVDLEGNGNIDLLINSITTLYCLNNEGKEKWHYKIGKIMSAPSVADIDNNGELDILVSAFSEHERSRSTIFCLNSLGEVKWLYTHNSSIWHSPTLADLDGDTTLELVFSSHDNKLHCLNHLGIEEWSFITNERVVAPPSVADINNDGNLEILFNSFDNFTYCLNNTGGEEWRYTSGDFSYFPIIADIDNNEFLEVIFSSDNKTLICLNYTGGKEWDFSTSNQPLNPVVADIDGDETLEIIVGTRDDGLLYILSHLGEEELRYDLSTKYPSSPSVADVNDDGILEILISGHPNYFYCFSFPNVISSGRIPWPRERGSNFNTGNIDSDSDYLDDLTENFYKTNETESDSDSDGLLDGLEVQIGLNPLVNDADEDKDNDGLTNFEELRIYHTSIFTSDTDNDGRKDGWEIDNGSDPLRWDNWSYLFGLYLLPAYGGIVAGIVFLRRLIIKNSRNGASL